jgi:sulfur-oxidizing protein SoxY
MKHPARPVSPQRRRLLAGVAGALALPLAGKARAQVMVESIVPAIRELTRGVAVRPGKVRLEIPRLADNGNSVQLRVTVQSAMAGSDHVRGIYLFSERNPRPVIAGFHLGPRAGRAELNTRIRLAGSQRVVAVAELSDGSFWSDTAEVTVTESACLDEN